MAVPAPVAYQTSLPPAPYVAPQPGPTYVQTVFGQRPFQVPAPVQTQPPQVPPPPSYAAPVSPVRQPPVYQPPQQPQQPQLPQMPTPAPGQQFNYGWMQDPLYYYSRMMPVPMRPQLQGEGFWERVAKNMALNGLEILCLEAAFAFRQSMMAPTPQWVEKSEP